MTPCDASKRSLLAARDARQATLERCAAGVPDRPLSLAIPGDGRGEEVPPPRRTGRDGEGRPGGSLIALSLAIPGAEKSPPGSPALFAWAEAELARAVPSLRPLHHSRDALGPFAVFAAEGEPAEVKACCVAIEAGLPAARLLDLDVYGPGLAPVDRAALGLPPRACLCCDAPARECIRVGRHSFPELVERARALLCGDAAGENRPTPIGPHATQRLAAALAEGLLRELRLTPKPGLVDQEDSGSHPDLTFALMGRSVALVEEYLRDLAASLARGEPLAAQVALGQAAEGRMLSELGANTHKGAIFLCGLLLVARHRAFDDGEPGLRRAISEVAGELLGHAQPRATHGAEARHRFGVGGILREALCGLPSLFEVALPAFRGARRAGSGEELAAFATLAALMQAVEDTTALHRCGLGGLTRLREDGAALSALLATRGDHLAFLRERNRAWRRMNLTMGGVADLLGVALGWLAYTTD